MPMVIFMTSYTGHDDTSDKIIKLSIIFIITMRLIRLDID